MTFNIRYDTSADGRHAWPHRRALALETIRAHDPDLLGLQEPAANQWNDIAAALPGWVPFGVGGDELTESEFDPQGGFVRSARFEIRAAGMFWLSDTPDVAGSISWPNDWEARRCGWVRLQDRQVSRPLIFACTHFDTNAGAWLPSAKVLHAELDRVAGETPIVVVGDFNCAAGSAAHQYLRAQGGYRDAWTEAGLADEGVVTFNGFTPVSELPVSDASTNSRIDWILLRGPLACLAVNNDYRCEEGLLPSDHYPVIAQLDWEA